MTETYFFIMQTLPLSETPICKAIQTLNYHLLPAVGVCRAQSRNTQWGRDETCSVPAVRLASPG